ncbi:11736_t:CDS:2, partial [Cetraspora pellucida]
MSNCMGVISVSYNLFPKVDKEMSKCLTPHILSAERLKMAQCLYFIASKVELDIIENSDINVTNRFIKDLYDAKQILLKSMIAEVGEKNVREVWKITDMRSENKDCENFVIVEVVAETCYFVSQKAAQNFSDMILSPNPSTVPVSVTAVLRSAAKKKIKYGEAAQLAIEHNNYSEMVEWLRQFINQHKEIITTCSGSIQNWDFLEYPEYHDAKDVQKQRDTNHHQKRSCKQNTPVVHAVNLDIIVQDVRISSVTVKSRYSH